MKEIENSWESLEQQGRRSNQSIKEINSEYSLEGLVLKLKLQYFGHMMRRADSQEKTLMLRKTEGRRRRGQQRMVRWHHRLHGREFEWTLGDSEGQRRLACCSPRGCKELDTTERLNNNNSKLETPPKPFSGWRGKPNWPVHGTDRGLQWKGRSCSLLPTTRTALVPDTGKGQTQPWHAGFSHFHDSCKRES